MGKRDAKFQAVAKRVVGRFVDDPLTFTRTVTPYGSQTGPGGSTVQTFEVLCSPPTGYSPEEVDGTRIQSGDLEMIVPVLNIPDEMGTPNIETDTVSIDGHTWRIVRIEPLRGGDEIADYTLQLRR